LDVLDYAYNTCDWDIWTCAIAVRNGLADLLKLARTNGRDCDETACANASGFSEVLKWACANGCPWDGRLCTAAAMTKNGLPQFGCSSFMYVTLPVDHEDTARWFDVRGLCFRKYPRTLYLAGF
jgi:hypothetical protein